MGWQSIRSPVHAHIIRTTVGQEPWKPPCGLLSDLNLLLRCYSYVGCCCCASNSNPFEKMVLAMGYRSSHGMRHGRAGLCSSNMACLRTSMHLNIGSNALRNRLVLCLPATQPFRNEYPPSRPRPALPYRRREQASCDCEMFVFGGRRDIHWGGDSHHSQRVGSPTSHDVPMSMDIAQYCRREPG